jgi:hypothetical protein
MKKATNKNKKILLLAKPMLERKRCDLWQIVWG